MAIAIHRLSCGKVKWSEILSPLDSVLDLVGDGTREELPIFNDCKTAEHGKSRLHSVVTNV